ncbi:hypothetical protein VTK56DRAFT_1163 [Thermocarpiscus australiensis]
MPPQKYVCLSSSPRCDICGDHLSPIEPLVALVGNESSTAFELELKVTLDGLHKGIVFGGEKWTVCDRLTPWESGDCRRSCLSRDSRLPALFHPDCLQLFTHECAADDARDRLWQTCVWRRVPWSGLRVPELCLIAKPAWHLSDGLLRCAERCGLPGQKMLPPELIRTILELVTQQPCLPFWRCVSALDMAGRLSSLSTGSSRPLKSVHLR